MVEQTTKKQQNLTILINKDKVVMDYRLSDGPIVKATTEMSAALIIPITLGTQTSTNSRTEEVNPKH
jgi:hypothetical protein